MHGQDVKLPDAVSVLKVSVTHFQELLITADTEASPHHPQQRSQSHIVHMNPGMYVSWT